MALSKRIKQKRGCLTAGASLDEDAKYIKRNWREYLTEGADEDEDQFIDKYSDPDLWNLLYQKKGEGPLEAFSELRNDTTVPLITEFCDINWDIRDKLLKEATIIFENMVESRRDEYLSEYLIPWLRGGRYGNEDNELRQISSMLRLELDTTSFATLCEWFLEKHNFPPLISVTDMRYWISIHESFYEQAGCMQHLIPYLMKEKDAPLEWNPTWDTQKVLRQIEDVKMQPNDQSLALRQAHSVMINYSRILW